MVFKILPILILYAYWLCCLHNLMALNLWLYRRRNINLSLIQCVFYVTSTIKPLLTKAKVSALEHWPFTRHSWIHYTVCWFDMTQKGPVLNMHNSKINGKVHMYSDKQINVDMDTKVSLVIQIRQVLRGGQSNLGIASC